MDAATKATSVNTLSNTATSTHQTPENQAREAFASHACHNPGATPANKGKVFYTYSDLKVENICKFLMFPSKEAMCILFVCPLFIVVGLFIPEIL